MSSDRQFWIMELKQREGQRDLGARLDLEPHSSLQVLQTSLLGLNHLEAFSSHTSTQSWIFWQLKVQKFPLKLS